MPEMVPGVPGAQILEVDFLPDMLEGAIRVAPTSTAKPGALLRIMPGIGKFLARNGSTIEVCADKDADPDAVSQFVHGALRAALIYQRGGFALHGACLAPPGQNQAIVLAGPSGAGKSTLAGELVRRGWSLLGDDLTPIYHQTDGLMAWPSRPVIKLWSDSCNRMGINVTDLARIPGERDKYALPAETRQEPSHLRAIFFLERPGSGGILPITGPERLVVLTENSYRPHYLKGLGCVKSHFMLTCKIAQEVQLSYLRHNASVATCADLLASEISGYLKH